MTGTELYKAMLAFDYGDQERNELMAAVWRGTPWMVDVFTDRINSDRERAIRQWCHENMGDEASPFSLRSGRWYRGSATVFGFNWYGFSTEEDMRLFLEHWPSPPPPNVEEVRH